MAMKIGDKTDTKNEVGVCELYKICTLLLFGQVTEKLCMFKMVCAVYVDFMDMTLVCQVMINCEKDLN